MVSATHIKPPLGLTPKYVWEELRRREILAAMQRYAIAEKAAPIEWCNELAELWRMDLREGK